MGDSARDHWDTAYQGDLSMLSWYEPEPTTSLGLIDELAIETTVTNALGGWWWADSAVRLMIGGDAALARCRKLVRRRLCVRRRLLLMHEPHHRPICSTISRGVRSSLRRPTQYGVATLGRREPDRPDASDASGPDTVSSGVFAGPSHPPDTIPSVMHRRHCEHAVTQELRAVAGVESIDVDLETKLVTVIGSALDDATLRAAIDEAGYEAA